MVDKVKPLKIENPASGGTQTDMLPVEATPASDYLASAGVAFQNSDTRLLDLDGSGNIRFMDAFYTSYLPLYMLRRPIVSEVSDTNDATTSSTTDALLTGMTITPGAGNYLVMFTTTITSNTAGAAISASIYVNGVQQPETLMKISPLYGGILSVGTARASVAITNKITATAAQAVEVRWSTSGGTATCGPRIMCLMTIT